MSTSSLRHAPDLVIGVRVVLAFFVIALFSLPLPFALAGLVLTVVVIAMDGLDGYLARRLGVADEVGAVLDIAADRVVEHVFWIYFAVAGLVPLWVPLVIVTRSFAVDTVRSMALARGRTAFGDKTMMREGLSRLLVASRAMRSVYGVAKVASFVLLGGVIVVERAAEAGFAVARVAPLLDGIAFGVVLATVALNLLRGMPVLWDSRPFFRRLPKEA